MKEFVSFFLNNSILLGIMCFCLTMIPIYGIMLIHRDEKKHE